MHSATQIIAQRAPPAIRTKTRWQPYHSISQSNALALRSPTVAYHNTPSSIVPPSQDFCPIELSAKEPTTRPTPIPPTPITQTPKDASQRDNSKHKFAAGLIDQAVNILTEIWRPQDVPDIFKAPSKSSAGIGSALGHALPLAPHHSMSPITIHPSQTPIAAIMASQPSSSFIASAPQTSNTAENNLLPMKTFVHEVLKRSRTSGSILQAALCYLEAIRPKIPEILQQEKMGIRAHYQPETKILPATEAELAREAELAAIDNAFDAESMEQEPVDEMKTVRVTDGESDDFDSMQQILEDSASVSSLIAEPPTPVDASSSSAPRSPSLPSPLLCPRRAFLASLILASKFFQDKCYSNRAWAKLSGLPPREIGRCERALGQALEWRLWVGKSAIQGQATSPPPSTRTIVRSQSEGAILPTVSISTSSSLAPVSRSLRKCSTLPSEMFNASSGSSIPPAFSAAPAVSVDRDMCFESQKSDVPFATSSTTLSSLDSSQPQFTEKGAATPSPDTPGLTYSPSSTDSSSAGDRTIQMSTFEDNMFPSFGGSQSWLDISVGIPADGTSFSFGGNSKMYSAKGLGFDASQTKPQSRRIAIVGSDLAAFGSHAGNCLWHADNRCIALETTDVH